MSTSQNASSHQIWLWNTLYALRGHFRDKAPDDPPDLTLGQTDAKGVLHTCIDSRLDERGDFHVGRGELFASTAAGAGIPAYTGLSGPSLPAQIDIGYPIIHSPNVHYVIVIGHTHCGANHELFHALLNGTKVTDNPKAAWMLPLAPAGLEEALKKARAVDGRNDEPLKRIVEKLIILQSINNLYGYVFEGKSVQALVNDGRLHVVGAIRDLKKDKNGNLPLSVYDPGYNEFRRIEDLYEEAFPEKKGSPIEKIESWAKAHLPSSPGVFIPISSLTMRKGAESTTVAEYHIKKINETISSLLDKIKSLGTSL